MDSNLVRNHDFREGDATVPAGWEAAGPSQELRPGYGWKPGSLWMAGNGNAYAIGYWRQRVPVEGGRTYCLRVRFGVEGIDDINLHVMNMILWRRATRAASQCPHDHVTTFCREDGFIIGEEHFQVPQGVDTAEVQLGLRFAPQGRVVWHDVQLVPGALPPSRPARIAVVCWRGGRGATVNSNYEALARLLDQAGALGSDLVLLPEYAAHNGTGLKEAEAAEPVPQGPSCRLFAAKARQHQMHVCGGIVEHCDGVTFNTAVLFGRSGEFVGKYRKVHPYWPEEIFEGVCPGDEFPVFQLDIGTIGIMICYDSWYGETARLLALKGAELVLFPNAGYEPLLMPARAIDNRCYVAVSSLGGPAMVVNTLGERLAETRDGLACVQVDLSFRPSPHPNAGGSLNASAAGRRGLRHSRSNALYEEICREVQTWENRPDHFQWLKRE